DKRPLHPPVSPMAPNGAFCLESDMEPISPWQAAGILGISRSKVYDLAAPEGPIPCARFGRRIVFDRADLLEYMERCRYTETKNAVVSSLSSTAVSIRDESELESIFHQLGVVPK